jgi:hypothetical protein
VLNGGSASCDKTRLVLGSGLQLGHRDTSYLTKTLSEDYARANVSCQFKTIAQCHPGELIRSNILVRDRFAIVGRRQTGLFPILILDESLEPCWFNGAAPGSSALVIELEQQYVLSYGKAYSLEPDHNGVCDIGDGPLFQTNGAFIVQGPLNGLVDRYIRAECSQRNKPTSYFDLGTGEVHGEPGAYRAAFASWTLSLLDSDGELLDDPLIKYPAQTKRQKAAAA